MQSSEVQTRRRPLGVSIIAILEAIEGIVLVLLGVFALIALNQLTGSASKAVVGVLAGGSLLFGVLALIFAWGLWTLRRWAFWLTVILQVLSLVGSIVSLTQANGNTGSTIAGMIIPVIVLLYFLIDRNVRAAFRV